MCSKMLWSLWTMNLLLWGLGDLGPAQGAISPLHCHVQQSPSLSVASAASNGTQELQSTLCSADEPKCATWITLHGQNASQTLGCTTEWRYDCSLSFTNNTHLFICYCSTDRCNAPFTDELFVELQKFIASNTTWVQGKDYMENFLERSYQNKTLKDLYDVFTKRLDKIPSKVNNNKIDKLLLPKPEPLKQEQLSDDDDDDGEGSGAYDDPRNNKRPANTQPTPSSHLPAGENSAFNLKTCSHLFYIICLLFTR